MDNNNISQILSDVQRLLNNYNTGKTGGYLSITNGKYRIIVKEINGDALNGATNTARICRNAKTCDDASNKNTCYNEYKGCPDHSVRNNHNNELFNKHAILSEQIQRFL